LFILVKLFFLLSEDSIADLVAPASLPLVVYGEA